MTNEGLAEALKCVPLDTKHEIGIFAPDEWISDKVEKFPYEINGIQYPCFKGRMFYDKEHSLLALTDDEKHLVGGVECGGITDMHIYIFPKYRGQGWMSSLMRSRVFLWEWHDDRALCAANATVYTGDSLSLIEQRYYLCMIGGLHVANERDFIWEHIEHLYDTLIEIGHTYCEKCPEQNNYKQCRYNVDYKSMLISYFVGYFLYEDVLPFHEMENEKLLRHKMMGHPVYDFMRNLWKTFHETQVSIMDDYHNWENEYRVNHDCGHFQKLITERLYDTVSCHNLWFYVNRYYYLKEKMENRCVLDSNMVFDNQWYEGEMYKWRLRYRFEHGYRIDDCYRYDYQKEEFVK